MKKLEFVLWFIAICFIGYAISGVVTIFESNKLMALIFGAIVLVFATIFSWLLVSWKHENRKGDVV